ncbi:hypothetical protein [Nocardia brasiliensis]|uniref:AbiEi antitoxin C-terminal domain-containing protein n=1 Tax=Nocardia brasiliensis (strain ATCC 700358 / HUJEG-1) TaxID=1133849 RepID=K0EUR6_NOCB7|nr:hypothetical protein [Nocardia brasiliensis]AFU03538.1 hypothetical protein O3I_027945 [Nocardia brasiliensis ATCC 700358]
MDRVGVHRRSVELRRGLSDEEIRQRYSGGDWCRLRRGAYVDRATYRELDPVGRHRTLIDAVASVAALGTAISHQSAAVVYGAPLWRVPLDKVHVTRDRRTGGRVKSDVKIHCVPLDAVAEVDGLLVTTPARTVVDLARTLPFESAVVTGDVLLRDFGLSDDELAVELEQAKSRSGIAAAKRVIAFLDGRTESAGESRSRVLLARSGLPEPTSQGNVFDGDGKFLGRVDFYFEGTGVLCEFDGRVKYGRLLRPGQDAGDVVFAEKVREDAMRACGFQLVRWTWSDLDSDQVAGRVRAALARARRAPADGHVEQAARIRTPSRDLHPF